MFLDELTEFRRSTLEVLRCPLEDGKITIGRYLESLTFPCKFMLVASMNPCPCGFLGSNKECRCSEDRIKKYIGKISGPLLDRIDIQVAVNSVQYEDLEETKEESSLSIKNRVDKARKIQNERYKNLNIFSNSELTPNLIDDFCKIDLEGRKILKSAFDRLGLSARAHDKILKVARTIADLDESKDIKTNHLLEAIQYRSLDKKYGGF